MVQKLRIAAAAFFGSAAPIFRHQRPAHPGKDYRAILLGAVFGLVGGNYVFAEKPDSSPSPRRTSPKLSSYKFVICGGGVAAKEALNVFIEEKHAGDVLLVTPDWSRWDARDTRPKDVADPEVSSSSSETQTASFSKAFQSLYSALPRLSPSPPKSAEIITGHEVTELDPTSRLITLDDGTQISFEKCLIAVGVSPPPIPIGKVVSHDAFHLVGSAWSSADWHTIDNVIRDATSLDLSSETSGPSNRVHFTVVGGSWMSAVVGATLIDRGADVTFSYADPSFLSRCLPKYLSRDIYNRLMFLSDGGVDLLSYAALRYIVARRPLIAPESSTFSNVTNTEAEVHVGTVFDAFSIVNFRTDFVVFAPTLPSATPISVPTISKRDGAFVANAELAVASDVYVAGACADISTRSDGIQVGSDTSAMSRWSADHARATGRHAAHNMLGARKPFPSEISTATIDLGIVSLKVTVMGRVDGSLESFGYFTKSREPDAAYGGEFERGVLFCVEAAPLRFRGAPMQLNVTGVAFWDGVGEGSFYNLELSKEKAVELIRSGPKSRADLEAAMDSFAAEHADIRLFEAKENNPLKVDDESVHKDGDGRFNSSEGPSEEGEMDAPKNETTSGNLEGGTKSKPLDTARRRNSRVIWRRHQSARIVPLRTEELLWVDDAWVGSASPAKKVDKKVKAFTDLMRKNSNQRPF